MPQPVVPPRFCDDRVAVLQADARTLTPAILESYTKDVSAHLQQPWKQRRWWLHTAAAAVVFVAAAGRQQATPPGACLPWQHSMVSSHRMIVRSRGLMPPALLRPAAPCCALLRPCCVLLRPAAAASQGFDVVLSDMLQFTSGVNDVELSLELAATAMNVATGHYYDEYGEAYAQQMGFRHSGFLRPGGNLVMKVYEVRRA